MIFPVPDIGFGNLLHPKIKLDSRFCQLEMMHNLGGMYNKLYIWNYKREHQKCSRKSILKVWTTYRYRYFDNIATRKPSSWQLAIRLSDRDFWSWYVWDQWKFHPWVWGFFQFICRTAILRIGRDEIYFRRHPSRRNLKLNRSLRRLNISNVLGARSALSATIESKKV